MKAAADLIRQSARLLLSPGQVVELRALHVQHQGGRRGTLSGYFDSAEPLVKAAAHADEHDASGVYVTINPADPRLLNRRRNRAELVGKDDPLTSDRDISAPVSVHRLRPPPPGWHFIEQQRTRRGTREGTGNRHLASSGGLATRGDCRQRQRCSPALPN
jgi:hypothetical protein